MFPFLCTPSIPCVHPLYFHLQVSSRHQLSWQRAGQRAANGSLPTLHFRSCLRQAGAARPACLRRSGQRPGEQASPAHLRLSPLLAVFPPFPLSRPLSPSPRPSSPSASLFLYASPFLSPFASFSSSCLALLISLTIFPSLPLFLSPACSPSPFLLPFPFPSLSPSPSSSS